MQLALVHLTAQQNQQWREHQWIWNDVERLQVKGMATPTELTHKYFRQKQCHNPKEMHMIHYQHWDYKGKRNGTVYEWT